MNGEELKMNEEELEKYWGCVTCGQEFPEDANWCDRCQTYKNFDWIEVNTNE